MRPRLAHELCGALVFLAACGDAAPPGNSTVSGGAGVVGGGGSGGGGSAGAATLSFAADIWPVIDQTRDPPWVYRGTGSYDGCTTGGVCHGGPNPGARLAMTAAESTYGALVNVLSTTSLCAGTIRVVPGDPDQSCLVLFYQGRLKDDLGWVDQAEVDLMRRWIADGARP